MKKKILISTGGSGGHVIPAISIYEHLNEEYEIIISTDKRGLKYMEKMEHKLFTRLFSNTLLIQKYPLL